jgi:hypothetical protein
LLGIERLPNAPSIANTSDAVRCSISDVIYGLTVQEVGQFVVFRCPQCVLETYPLPLIIERSSGVKIYCEVHPENFGMWPSETHMQQEKLSLAKRIGLVE